MTALSLLLALSACNPLDGEDRYALTGPEANRLVSSVEIEPSGAILEPDGMGQFAAVVKSARGLTVSRNVSWAVVDEDVIQIDGSGNVVGLNEGTTTLKATHQGVTGDVTVDVRGDVVSLRLNRESVEVAEGEATQLTATFVYANGAEREVAAPLEWRSADPTILGMDSDGLTWGVGSGQTRIHVRGRGHEVVADGRVLPTTVRRVEVGAPTETLEVGEEARFWADVLDDHGNRVFRLIQWSSSNNSVATVSAHGVVKALAEGKATIRAATETVTGSLAIEVVSVGSQAGGGSDGSARETRPGTVTNLSVVSTTRNGATLRFTEVDDGEGQPAKYDIRYAESPLGYGWGSATSVQKGSCTVPLEGTAVGTTLTCTVEGLQAGTKYDFQLVPFRGTMNQDAVYGPLSDVASGTTEEAPIQVEVLPSGATLEVDGKRRLEASVTDVYGNPVDRSVSWSSTRTSVATVSGSGTNNRYGDVAARNVGDTDIRASAGGATGISRIRVVEPAPPPSAGGGANEPSGFVTVTERTYHRLDEHGWRDQNVGLVQDADAPFSPPGAARFRYPRGFQDGSAPGASQSPNFSYGSVYSSFSFKLSSNWQGHTVASKLIYITDSSEGGGGDPVYLALAGSPSGPYGFQVRLQSPDLSIGGNLRANLSDGWIRRGRWHTAEVLLSMNRGDSDGEVHVWIDGVKTHEYRSVKFVGSGSNRQFDNWRWQPVWGGKIGAIVEQDMYIYFDHVYISGK